MEIGTRVRVVKYGSPLFSLDPIPSLLNQYLGRQGEFYVYDKAPQFVGREGVISYISHGHDYSIEFDNGDMVSWFSARQLEKIDSDKP